jgi:hypothetical protein
LAAALLMPGVGSRVTGLSDSVPLSVAVRSDPPDKRFGDDAQSAAFFQNRAVMQITLDERTQVGTFLRRNQLDYPFMARRLLEQLSVDDGDDPSPPDTEQWIPEGHTIRLDLREP